MTAPPAGESITGDDEGNLIRADKGNDIVGGGLGNDIIYGEEGDDVIRGDKNISRAGTTVAGGDDILYGGLGNDRIGGKAGNDHLFGDEGDDSLWGDAGDDTLTGGAGNDFLAGDDFDSRGSDTFVLAPAAGTDTIADFQVGRDVIGLAGGLSFSELLIARSGSNTSIAFNGETLAILQGVTASLTDSSFVEIA
ncbi:MAG: hypothetical protein HC925_08690 [Coleofasciculaceae cyanobacterium SM2_3_26]|nr:hypothetical protein [Coleofasciculaceae cyanobacterium SM2_3_26]